MSLRPALALVFGLAAGSAAAQDAVEAPGMLTDYDFYQLVSCGAPMSEVCREPVVRWRLDGVVRVALRRIDRAYLGRKKLRAEAALTRAVQALKPTLTQLSVMPVPEMVPIPGVAGLIDEEGNFQADERHEKGAATMLGSLAKWSGALETLRQ